MADAVDGDPRERSSLPDLDEAGEFLGVGGAVVVDEQFCAGRRILSRGLECDVDVALPEHLVERPVSKAIRLGRVERFVHDIPCVDL